MNGDYFKDFRKWLLCYFSIDALAVYASRKEHFKDMDILQEISSLRFLDHSRHHVLPFTLTLTHSMILDTRRKNLTH